MKLQDTPYLPTNIGELVRQLTTLWRQLVAWTGTLGLDSLVDGNVPRWDATSGTFQPSGWSGALALLGSAQSIPNSANTTISFASAPTNVDAWWDAANPARLTVPAGVERVRLQASVLWSGNVTGYRYARLHKNGAVVDGGFQDRRMAISTGAIATECAMASGIMAVTAGDYFELIVAQTSGGALTVATSNNGTWMSIEALK